MTRDKQILVGVVVLAALGGLVYMQIKKDANIGKTTETTSAELPDRYCGLHTSIPVTLPLFSRLAAPIASRPRPQPTSRTFSSPCSAS